MESHEELLRVLEPIGNEELKKQYLERVNQVWQVGLKEVLEKVNKELVGPYALGSSHSQSYPALFFLSFTPLLTCTPPSPPFIISEIDTNPNPGCALRCMYPLMDFWLICVLDLGDQLSLADVHLAVWLARIAHLSGALPSDDGNSVIEKIEGLVGIKFVKDVSIVEARRRAGLGSAVKLPGAGAEGKPDGAVSQTIQPSTDRSLKQSRIATFWETIKERPSWKKVYEAGLH